MPALLPDSQNQVQPFQPGLWGEVDFFHSTARQGFFSILSKKNDSTTQRSYRLSDLTQVLQLVDKRHDTYISQAEFTRPNRRVVNLARIGLCFVDVDFYGVDVLRYLTPDQVAGQILNFSNDNGIPIPSVIISSGRGLYLKWFLSSTIPRQALPRWNAIQGNLVSLFDSFGADVKAKDASRVLRLESTLNTKTGNTVQVIWGQETPTLYDFEELSRELLPLDRHELRVEKKGREARKTLLTLLNGESKARGHKGLNPLRLNWDRLEDIRKLAIMRGGVQPGARDIFLFLGICFASWVIAPGQLYFEAEALAREFAPGLSRNQIHGYTSTAINRAHAAAKGEKQEWNGQLKDPRYRYSNARLVEALRITPDEERHLKTIISQGEAKERDRLRDEKRRRATGARTRQSYLGAAKDRRATARLMAAQGRKPAEIAQALGVSRMSVSRYLSKD